MNPPALLMRPIFGGVFGFGGRYVLATTPVVAKGLHVVRFMVVDPISGAVLSIADDKTSALAAARSMLAASEQVAEELAGRLMQGELWSADELPVRPVVDRHRPISKRRRDIYAKCQGACHYCAASLHLDGPWHVEHMLPRALGGADDLLNLVAACVPCNLAKRDRTALEFVAPLAGGGG